jgi:hypothetical protein
MVHDDLIQCARCAIVFPRPHRTGRRPIYCSHTCRQRAFEARRRAAYHHCLPLPAPRRRARPHTQNYEAGRTGGIRHALRPDAPPARDGRRPTLCGTHANITTRQRFGAPGPVLGRDCRTCTRIATRHPLAQPLDPAADLAELKHLLLGARSSHRTGDGPDVLRNTFGLLLAAAFGPVPERRTA